MKRLLSTIIKRMQLLHSQNSNSSVAFRQLKEKLAGVPRYTSGHISFIGWDLNYVDAAALVSSIDMLIIKRWNDFITSNKHPVILDCGSNIGISVLNYIRQFPDAKITAFEPDPSIFNVLKRNLMVNGAENVEAIQAAVWVKNGHMPFYCEGADGSKIVVDSSLSKDILVPTIDLADFISGPIDFIKMDIEGAEYVVVPHLEDELKLVKSMIVECHIDNNAIEDFAKLLQTLASVGFSVSINSFGLWKDLLQRPKKINGFDQYVLLAAWRSED